MGMRPGDHLVAPVAESAADSFDAFWARDHAAVLALAAARWFSSRPIGIAAGVMLALYAPAIFFDGLLQKSVLDVFFVCLALWLMSRSEETAENAEIAEK